MSFTGFMLLFEMMTRDQRDDDQICLIRLSLARVNLIDLEIASSKRA